MTALASLSPQSAQTAEYVNPVISATKSVFEMMLGCTANRTTLRLKAVNESNYEVSAVIGVSGRAAGTIVVSLSKQAACAVLKRMLGQEATEVNRDVCDAVGELTNMIAGSAKAQLAKYELSISLPNVVSGSEYQVFFPSNVQPFVIGFESEIGPFTIEVGFHGL